MCLTKLKKISIHCLTKRIVYFGTPHLRAVLVPGTTVVAACGDGQTWQATDQRVNQAKQAVWRKVNVKGSYTPARIGCVAPCSTTLCPET
jgi:hypothetical protein